MKRPIAVTLIAGLYLLAGTAGLVYHAPEWRTPAAHHGEIVWVTLLRIAAIVAGIFLMRGQDWARWLAVGWIAFHVAISALDAWPQLLMHAVLMVVILIVLYGPWARPYFRKG